VGKAAGAWSLPTTPSSAEVKERVVLYLYTPSPPAGLNGLLECELYLLLMLKDNSKLSSRDWKQIAYTLKNTLPFET